MNREEKQAAVAQIKEQVFESEAIVITHYAGLTVDEITTLRADMREKGAFFKVVKNSLAKIALKDTPYETLSELFTGPVAVAFSSDPVAAAKGVAEFSKENEKLVIIGGGLNGELLDVSRVQALAKLPSLDELRAKIVGMLNTPATRVATVVQAPAGQVARVLNAYAEANA